MLKTLITNNCWAGIIYNNYQKEFCSPTINLQILPEEFPKFCGNLKHYLEQEVIECKEPSEIHKNRLLRMFGYIPDYPMGLIDDIILVFQHYETFEDAKEKWETRKKRVDYDSIGYLFHVKHYVYSVSAVAFMALHLPNSVCITEDFGLEGAYRFDVPPGMDAFGGVRGEDGNMRRIIEQNFKIKDWLEGKYETINNNPGL